VSSVDGDSDGAAIPVAGSLLAVAREILLYPQETAAEIA